jgi:hypothetical protein
MVASEVPAATFPAMESRLGDQPGGGEGGCVTGRPLRVRYPVQGVRQACFIPHDASVGGHAPTKGFEFD